MLERFQNTLRTVGKAIVPTYLPAMIRPARHASLDGSRYLMYQEEARDLYYGEATKKQIESAIEASKANGSELEDELISRFTHIEALLEAEKPDVLWAQGRYADWLLSGIRKDTGYAEQDIKYLLEKAEQIIEEKNSSFKP